MRHRPPSKLFLILHKDSQICFLLALISHAKVKWEALTFLVNFVVFTAYGDCETFIHSFIHSWMLFIFTFCKAFSWVYVLMHRNGHEANAYHSPLCWSVCLSGAGCYGASLSVRSWSLWCQSICQALVVVVTAWCFCFSEFDLRRFLCTESEQLIWKSEGLPSDDLSVENAIVILQVTDIIVSGIMLKTVYPAV